MMAQANPMGVEWTHLYGGRTRTSVGAPDDTEVYVCGPEVKLRTERFLPAVPANAASRADIPSAPTRSSGTAT